MKEDVAAIFDNMVATGNYMTDRFKDTLTWVDTRSDILKEEVRVDVATQIIGQNEHIDQHIETLVEHIDASLAATESKIEDTDSKLSAFETSMEGKIDLLMTELDIIRSLLNQPAAVVPPPSLVPTTSPTAATSQSSTDSPTAPPTYLDTPTPTETSTEGPTSFSTTTESTNNSNSTDLPQALEVQIHYVRTVDPISFLAHFTLGGAPVQPDSLEVFDAGAAIEGEETTQLDVGTVFVKLPIGGGGGGAHDYSLQAVASNEDGEETSTVVNF